MITRQEVTKFGSTMEKKSKTKPKYKYQIMIHWSPEDSVYLAIAPELEDCITHGETQKKA